MRWSDLRQSGNVEDARGGGRGLVVGGGGLAIVVLAVIVWLCGGDPSQLLQNSPSGSEVPVPGTTSNRAAGPDQERAFVGAIEGSLEDTWTRILPEQANVRFLPPKLVLFTGQISSACGYASSAMGPFYCPGDQRLYLDFAFFDQLKREFQAPGDFAQAYVIAHEFGHHIQNLVGTMMKVQRAGNGNSQSVALELQADCYAGVWGYYAQKQGRLDAGDVSEALRAAASVGDDMIQKRTQGYVVPETFTHGSAKQRVDWFTRGMQSGQMSQCQTFTQGR